VVKRLGPDVERGRGHRGLPHLAARSRLFAAT
jgi:hypothetical protein